MLTTKNNKDQDAQPEEIYTLPILMMRWNLSAKDVLEIIVLADKQTKETLIWLGKERVYSFLQGTSPTFEELSHTQLDLNVVKEQIPTTDKNKYLVVKELNFKRKDVFSFHQYLFKTKKVPLSKIFFSASFIFKLEMEKNIKIKKDVYPTTLEINFKKTKTFEQKINEKNTFAKKNTLCRDEIHQYSTKLIELQHKAIKKFWINYDKSNPPKQVVIIEWLKTFGISEREATAIDMIIRYDPYKSGGNRKWKK